MRTIISLCVAAIVSAAPAFADTDNPGNVVTDEEIRSGVIIDDGLDIPHIRPGTQYFEIHGSTRIARALGDYRLPTDDAGFRHEDDNDPRRAGRAAAW